MIGRRDVLGLAVASTTVFGVSAVISGRPFATAGRNPAVTSMTTIRSTGDVERLNVALSLACLGVQYHRRAATGDELPPRLALKIGRQGSVRGAHGVAILDPDLARYAVEIADDKVAHVAALQRALARAVAARPDIGPSGEPLGAFYLAKRAARLKTAQTTFDTFSADEAFLLGAFLMGNDVAACNRMLLLGIADANAHTTVVGVLADTIYHGGLIRSLLMARSAGDPRIAGVLASLCAMQASETDGYAADLIDAAGNPIPFMRNPT